MKDESAFYDTNVLIAYLFREENRFRIAQKVLRRHASKAISIITVHEIHTYSIRFNVEEKFIKAKELLHKLFKIVPLNQDICLKASYIRKNYRLPEIDSLILASALHGKYKHFYTFDEDFRELNDKIIEETRIHYLEHHYQR